MVIERNSVDASQRKLSVVPHHFLEETSYLPGRNTLLTIMPVNFCCKALKNIVTKLTHNFEYSKEVSVATTFFVVFLPLLFVANDGVF
jgi:predicted transcriptional regulator